MYPKRAESAHTDRSPWHQVFKGLLGKSWQKDGGKYSICAKERSYSSVPNTSLDAYITFWDSEEMKCSQFTIDFYGLMLVQHAKAQCMLRPSTRRNVRHRKGPKAAQQHIILRVCFASCSKTLPSISSAILCPRFHFAAVLGAGTRI